ncbi:hypothetical protein CW706_03725 [Candidatus Bathyarchaeota archaeon]|nr:MAG: hypothetical protein CW706_03725 [Candidatus Bathyarchaeota archaeon]
MLYLLDGFADGKAITLLLYDAESENIIKFRDENYKPYFLANPVLSSREEAAIKHFNCEISTVKKRDLFTGKERELAKIEMEDPSLLSEVPKYFREKWEYNISYLLSYIYDRGLVFGVPYKLSGSLLRSQCRISEDLQSIFLERFAEVKRKDPNKFIILKEFFSTCSQPIPHISLRKLGVDVSFGYEKIYISFLLSRVANLPLTAALENRRVSTWIKSIFHFYLRRENILIPTASELMRGEKPRRIPGGLTFPPKTGTYFNTVVVDFESLYPSIIDVYNLSYETVNCDHSECEENRVPGTSNHVCLLRRGIYSMLIGAIKDLRIHWFKSLVRDNSITLEERRLAEAASKLLKLILVSCYGVTVRIPGLSQPALAETITAYGRYILKETWKLAESSNLHPLYGDTDSLFLDNPRDEEVRWLIRKVKEKFNLDLAIDKIFSVCVLPKAMKAYFGVRKDGIPEVKGVMALKSSSPPFIQKIFMRCVKELVDVKNWAEFEEAKKKIRRIVDEAIEDLKSGRISLEDLAYQVKLHEFPDVKSAADELMSQPYQCAVQLSDKGVKVTHGSLVSFVKVKPFMYGGKRYTVKPLILAKAHEINTEDYIRNLRSALNQIFKPMNISLNGEQRVTLADFI